MVFMMTKTNHKRFDFVFVMGQAFASSDFLFLELLKYIYIKKSSLVAAL